MTVTMLIDWFRPFHSALVAFSGGLDSTVLARAAVLALGNRAIAITAYSSSSCESEAEEATQIAREIGIEHRLIESREFDDPRYLANDHNRCYYCKAVRFAEMVNYAKEHDIAVVVDGSNADDVSDFRPGKKAAEELGVRSPLAELGMTKEHARLLAKDWGISVWNKPSQPCLSTRIGYGISLTDSLLRQIEKAETFLKEKGFTSLRVRLPEKTTARIEVPTAQIPQIVIPETRQEIIEHFRRFGFERITIDLDGFRSGSMNEGDRG
ncbi:MAG: ATP-dependent sacrificial sulfur transferase LarE [Thermoguttaceae bacterium]